MSKWYSYKRILSYNAFLNVSMGGRGIGKSYGIKCLMIDNFVENKKQSVYIRRKDSEMDLVKATFFKDVELDEKYQEYQFEVKGDYGLINGEIAIFFIPLSVANNFRSASYPFVNYVVFDEYVSIDGKYLKNEMLLFYEVLETIFRSRNDGKVFVLANSVSYVNPLFDEYEIEPKENDRFIRLKNGLIVVEIIPPNDEFVEEKAKTNLMRLQEGTKYYDYVVNNKVLNDSEEFIFNKKPSGKYSFYASFYTSGMEVAIWYNQNNGLFYIDQTYERDSEHRYYLTMEDILPKYRYIKDYRSTVMRLKTIKRAIGDGNCRYKNQSVKKFVINTLSKYL